MSEKSRSWLKNAADQRTGLRNISDYLSAAIASIVAAGAADRKKKSQK